MRRVATACVMALALVFPLFAGAGEWVPITSSTPSPPRVTVLSDASEETVLRVDIPGYYLDEVMVDGVPHARVLFPKSPRLLRAGEPELPFVSVALAVNPTGTPRAEVLQADARPVQVGRYLPSKGSLSRSVDPGSVPFIFSPVYASAAPYPAAACEAGDPYLLRNVRGTSVAVYPVRFEPASGTLLVCPSVTVRVRTSGEGGANLLAARVPECREFQQIYESHFANGAEPSRSYTPVADAGGLLIITNDAFYDAMLPLVDWKRQKGIPTEILKLSAVGTLASQVKAVIQDRFTKGGLAFVLLVGDSAYMPFPTGTAGNVVGNAADPMYALLAGADSYPDIVVSRFPAQTATEASTMVNRVVVYEKTPQASATWYDTATGIASADGNPTDGERMEWLRSDLLSYGYHPVDQIYDPGATAAQVTAALNSGRGLVNYLGHGSDTAWGTTGFSVSNIYALTNTDQVPFIFDVACVNGRFNRNEGDCFAEAWLKAGTPAAPRGALGIYASSTNMDWFPPCDAQVETVDLLVAESYHTFGALCFNGVMKGLDMYPGTPGQQLFQQWHIFGDATEVVFTKTPTSMSVSHASTVGAGASSFAATAAGLRGALCALYDPASGRLLGSAFTNLAGAATIPLAIPPTPGMALTLTVTAFNRLPYTGSVTVAGTALQVQASASPTSGDWPLPVGFACSAAGGTPPYTYAWSFGDSGSSTLQNPSHTYAKAGDFQVVVTARDAMGTTAADSHLTITVTTAPCSLSCSASAPASGAEGVGVNFSASSTASGGCTGAAGYLWEFGDGEMAAQKNPVHAYSSAGTFTWNLTVSQSGKSCSKSGSITVAEGCGVTCGASASPAGGAAPLTVAFSGSATASHCTGVPSFLWAFGDGTASSEQNPSHAYESAGSFPWTLTASTDGKTCSRAGTVTVAEPCTLSCEASAAPASGTAPLAVTFSGSATAAHCAGTPAFAWTFGDGAASGEQNPSHEYAAAGTYGWTLTVTADGKTCSQAGTVSAVEPCTLSCEASASPASGTAPLSVAFSGSATASQCPGAPTFAWTFGDGATSTEPNPSHAYGVAGSFLWTLTVTADGKTCSQTGAVTVVEPCTLSCQASASPASGTAPLTAAFSGSATASHCAGATTFAWAFGDGATSSEQSPSHTYAGAGSFAWTLTITAEGRTCTQTGSVEVRPGVPGDADGDGLISIGEVQQAVNMFLGLLPPGNGVDCDGSGEVSVGEIQRVLNGFLGIPSACP